MSYVVLSLAFLAGFLLIVGLNLFLADLEEDRRRQIRERLDEEFRLQQREKARGSMAHKDLYELAAEGYVELGSQTTVTERLVQWVDQSGVAMRPAQLVAWCLVSGILAATLVGSLLNHWVFAAMAAPLGAALPAMYVTIRLARRRRKLLSQLPDAFDLMSRVLKAGQTISQALQSVADEFTRPIAEEFGYCWEQQNLGLSPEAAMRDLARRTGLLEMKIFVVAVMVHRQTGGNLSELLEKLAKVIRDRQRICDHVAALTAEGRFQAYILLGLPVTLLFAISALNQSYMAALLQYPALLVGMFVFEILGALWMRRIIRFDF